MLLNNSLLHPISYIIIHSAYNQLYNYLYIHESFQVVNRLRDPLSNHIWINVSNQLLHYDV